MFHIESFETSINKNIDILCRYIDDILSILYYFLISNFSISDGIRLDLRFRKFNKFQENEASNALKKYVTKFINEQKIDSINTTSNTWSNKKAKLNIINFNEMNIEDKSLTSLNREFKEYGSKDIECE